jgi:hypothetical protein
LGDRSGTTGSLGPNPVDGNGGIDIRGGLFAAPPFCSKPFRSRNANLSATLGPFKRTFGFGGLEAEGMLAVRIAMLAGRRVDMVAGCGETAVARLGESLDISLTGDSLPLTEVEVGEKVGVLGDLTPTVLLGLTIPFSIGEVAAVLSSGESCFVSFPASRCMDGNAATFTAARSCLAASSTEEPRVRSVGLAKSGVVPATVFRLLIVTGPGGVKAEVEDFA